MQDRYTYCPPLSRRALFPIVRTRACVVSASFAIVLNPQRSVSRNALNFGKVPFLVAKWTHGARLEPALNAVQVKDVPAITKGNAQTIVVGRRRIGLILNGRFVERIATNGALEKIKNCFTIFVSMKTKQKVAQVLTQPVAYACSAIEQ